MYSDNVKKGGIIFLCIAFLLFCGLIGFFSWHTVRMRNFEMNYVRTEGVVTGIGQIKHSGTHYYRKISYDFDGKTYTFMDRKELRGFSYEKVMGSSHEIYVDPQNPERAETIKSSGFVSTICAFFFAFFCITYAAAVNILLGTKRSSFKKRLLFSWGVDILLGVVFMLLFWLGLPQSGFGEVFTRFGGAVGVTVVTGMMALAALLDGILTYVLHRKKNK